QRQARRTRRCRRVLVVRTWAARPAEIEFVFISVIPFRASARFVLLQGEWVRNDLRQSAKRLVRTDYCTVETSAVRGIDGNVAGGLWRAVGGERRPALQIRGGLNDVIQVGLSSQRELKLTT